MGGRLTWRSHDLSTTSLLHLVMLLRHQEFLGRVLDQDPQVVQELPHIVCTVLSFNEIDMLFDGGTGAGKIYNGLYLGVCPVAGIQGERSDQGLNLLAPR